MRKLAFVSFVFATAVLVAQDPPDVEVLKKGQPKDVSAFISRAFGCWHFSGEEAYSNARGEQIRAAMAKLRCDRLARDESRLRRKYRKTPSVLKALDATRSF